MPPAASGDESFTSLLSQVVRLAQSKAVHAYVAVTSFNVSWWGAACLVSTGVGAYLVTKGINLIVMDMKFKGHQ